MTAKEIVNHANGEYHLLHKLEYNDAIDWSALAESIQSAGLTLLFVQRETGEQVPYLAWYEE